MGQAACLPWPLQKPSLAGQGGWQDWGAAAKGHGGMWGLISGGCEGLHVLWGTNGLQGWAASPVADSYHLIALRMLSTCPDPMSFPGTCILPRYHLNQLKSQQEHKLGQRRHVHCSPGLRDPAASSTTWLSEMRAPRPPPHATSPSLAQEPRPRLCPLCVSLSSGRRRHARFLCKTPP